MKSYQYRQNHTMKQYIAKSNSLSLSLSLLVKPLKKYINPRQPKYYRSGFTIVELLIVIVIIAILAAITVVAYNGIQDSATETVLKSDLRNVSNLLEVERAGGDTETYPPGPSLPSDARSSSGVRLQYTTSTDRTSYCLTASAENNSRVSAYHIDTSSGNTSIQEGICSGHNSPISASCPTGFIKVPGNSRFSTSDFCVMKYEAKNVGGVATSQASGNPWVSISQTSAISVASSACTGCHLITNNQWLTIAHNVLSVPSNWSSGTIGSGYIYSGHNDNSPANSLPASSDSDGYSGTGNTSGNQRRTLTLTNGEVIWDLAGNVWEWTSGTVTGANSQPGLTGESAFAWKEWNAITTSGSLATSVPSYGTSAASGWTGSNGIGRLYSNAGDTATRGLLRGGRWDHGGHAGVLALALNSAPSDTGAHVGFRVAQGN